MNIIMTHKLKFLGVSNNCDNIDLFQINDDFVPITIKDKNFFVGENKVYLNFRKGTFCFTKDYNKYSNLNIEINHDTMNIKLNGGFLSASENDFFIQTFMGDWEKFHFLKIDIFNVIKQSFQKGLYTSNPKLFINDGCFSYIDGKINIGNDILDVIKIKKIKLLPFNKMMIPRDNLGVNIYEIYNPVVYFCCFGENQIISCLEETIFSLYTFGKYSGDVIVITDNNNLYFSEKIEKYKSKISFKTISAYDFLDFTISRFSIEPNFLKTYSPVMYMDCDIIVNNDINDLLHKSMSTNNIIVSKEYDLENPDKWYGKEHWEDSGEIYDFFKFGINSGIFIYKNIDYIYDILQLVSESIIHSQHIKNTRSKDVLPVLDQINFNYIIMCYFHDRYDSEILNQYVKHASNENFSLIPNIGFAHFNGNMGNFETRVDLMRSYVSYLNEKY